MVKLVPTAPAEIRAFREQLAGLSWVAVDTEFHAERRYWPKLYLVQLAGPEGEAWLADPLEPAHQEALDGLPDHPWVVHAGGQDVRLVSAWLGRAPTQVWDTQIGASLASPLSFPVGLDRCVRHFLGRVVDKGETMSDWSRRPLAPAQLAYAAEDVLVVRELFAALDRALTGLGRRGAWDAACAAALATALDPQPAIEQAERLLAQTGAEGLQAGLIAELCQWRDERAREQDQPPTQILSDGILTDLAKRAPTSAKAIAANRRIPASFTKTWGSDVAETVARVTGRAAWAHPRAIPREGPDRARATWLGIVVEAQAQALGVSSRLLAPTSLCERLVLDAPADRAALAERLGWRDPLIGEALWGALRGEGSVRFDGERLKWSLPA